MITIPNMIIVAGTGRRVGKTTVAQNIISKFRDERVCAVKISSHMHKLQEHMDILIEESDYVISEERSMRRRKDSSRLLAAGAKRSFYIQAVNDKALYAFEKLYRLIPEGRAIVCESPSLGKHIAPGVIVVVTRDLVDRINDKRLEFPADREIYCTTTSRVESGEELPIVFTDEGFSLIC